ncbi:MAG: FtsW/RodA/SpoVE family cell cycle protein, partial [Eubacterium sp.]|nr:FtsW/RodA/SpoVE family cell cycle protein [Eubacterium sp.]
VFIHISLQVILNICVVLNIIPTTGVTLPFVSYGGTSVLFLMLEIGVALSVARKIEVSEEGVTE